MTYQRRKAWQGVRTRRVLVAAEPDEAPRWVELPTAWDDVAASCLAAICHGGGPTSLAEAAEAWLARLPPDLAEIARGLLLFRRGAPEASVWQGRPGGFVLNLSAFDEPGLGLDATALRKAAVDAVQIITVLTPDAPAVLRITDLDGMLAASGLDYGDAGARTAARSVVEMVREAADGASLVGGTGRIDDLLGVEAGGIAPRFDWLRESGQLSNGARAFLAARGLSAETALGRMLAGQPTLRLAGAADHAAMRTILAPFMNLPELLAPAAATARREPPARPGGYARRVTLGGHRVFVRTAEFDDGMPAEISLGLPRESAVARALADSLCQITSLALQHGTPLAEIVDLLAGTRFGPAGPVDGDPEVGRSSSPLDYLARSLAAAYLPGVVLDPVQEEDPAPSLPLDLPKQARPRLRVVQ